MAIPTPRQKSVKDPMWGSSSAPLPPVSSLLSSFASAITSSGYFPSSVMNPVTTSLPTSVSEALSAYFPWSSAIVNTRVSSPLGSLLLLSPLLLPVALALPVGLLASLPRVLQWSFWLAVSGVYTVCTLMYAAWTLLVIAMDITMLTLLKGAQLTISRFLWLVRLASLGAVKHERETSRSEWRKILDECECWGDFRARHAEWEKKSQSPLRRPALRKTWSVWTS